MLAVFRMLRQRTIQTAHGEIKTPCFMPIATKGAVRTLSSQDLRSIGAQIILANTYHLALRPGLEAMRQLGGLHQFMGWNRPILTDSGGYQVFSLGEGRRDSQTVSRVRLSEDGVEFRSPLDGSLMLMTPEGSIEMQSAIGSDILMCFDDVAAAAASRQRVEEAMKRSLRWAGRCKDKLALQLPTSNPQSLFGIVQGGIHDDLREQSAKELMRIGFNGYAIGGLSVGESRADAKRIIARLSKILPTEVPRYFMGGGFPEEILYYVGQGMDMFDCVLPTRNARHGFLFVWADEPFRAVSAALSAVGAGADDQETARLLYRTIRITNETFRLDTGPIDPYAANDISRSYLRHLFSIQEPLAMRLATEQNLRFYLRLFEEVRNYKIK